MVVRPCANYSRKLKVKQRSKLSFYILFSLENRIKYSSNTHLWWSAPGLITQGKLKVKQRSRVYYKIALNFYSSRCCYLILLACYTGIPSQNPSGTHSEG